MQKLVLFAALCFSISLFPALAQSDLPAIQLPKGVAASGETAGFDHLLRALCREKSVALTPQGQTSVVVWSGQNFRRDRVKFTVAGTQNALESAGFRFAPIEKNELREVNIFSSFEDETLKLRPNITGISEYFVAKNDGAKKALVGAWIESDDALGLGLLPVQYIAPVVYRAIDPVPAGSIAVKNLADTAASLPRQTLPKFPNLARKPRSVRGYLRDMAGRPIKNAEVAVHASAGGGFRTTHKARSNAAGLYEVLVPAGVAEVVEVKTTVNYNGQKFDLRLEPAKGAAKQFVSQNGHVENWVLKTQGKGGGTIRVVDNLEKGILEITLKPSGALLDGTTGKPLVYRFNTGEGQSETYFHGLPLGRYQASARLFDEGEWLPVRVAMSFGTDAQRAYKKEMEVNFLPGFTYSSSESEKSSAFVQHFEIYVAP